MKLKSKASALGLIAFFAVAGCENAAQTNDSAAANEAANQAAREAAREMHNEMNANTMTGERGDMKGKEGMGGMGGMGMDGMGQGNMQGNSMGNTQSNSMNNAMPMEDDSGHM
jgi:hypothetical protein